MRLDFATLDWFTACEQPEQPDLSPLPAPLVGQERVVQTLQAAWATRQGVWLTGGEEMLEQTRAWLNQQGIPGHWEALPTRIRLFGGWQYQPDRQAGPLRPGALEKAAGGVLLLEMHSLLEEGVLPDLLRTLRLGRIEPWGGRSPEGLPQLVGEPAPLEAVVWLVGQPEDLAELQHLTGFSRVFPLGCEAQLLWSANKNTRDLLGGSLRAAGLWPTQGATAALLDQGRRWTGERDWVEADLAALIGLAREAGQPLTAQAVQRAAFQREQRLMSSEELFWHELRTGVTRLQLQGKAVGQVNGLVVLEGVAGWGRPARITAQAAPGREGLLSTDREAGLGGQIFNKAILTLAGYLRAHYGDLGPLAATVSLVFEQSYAQIEGDSAGLAELIAALSAIGDFELRQDVGITGAVDQLGGVQAVGGVTAKIEGFWRAYQALGLSGRPAVLFPRANLGQLVPSAEILTAVRAGQLELHAVATLDEALEVVSGLRGMRGVQQKVREGLEYFGRFELGESGA